MRVSLPITTIGEAPVLAALGDQYTAQGVAQAQHEVGRDHALADPATDAISTEVLAASHQATSGAG